MGGNRRQEKRWSKSGLTGVDVLLMATAQIEEREEMPPDLVRAFRQMLIDCFVSPMGSSPEAVEVAQRGLDMIDSTAAYITASSIGFAFENADQETLVEAVRVGLATSLRFREYLAVIGALNTDG